MVWNKTSDEVIIKIISLLENVTNSYTKISSELNISTWLVGQIANQYLSKELLKARYKYSCSQSKLGNKNPMKDKTGTLHHNSVTHDVRVSGYKTVFAPSWWQGSKVKSGRIFEHHFVWASAYNQVAIPKKFCIHHIDLNKDNNTIENLQLLSISDHMKLHSEIRKVQRLERKLVENSVLEAHGNLNQVDDIV